MFERWRCSCNAPLQYMLGNIDGGGGGCRRKEGEEKKQEDEEGQGRNKEEEGSDTETQKRTYGENEIRQLVEGECWKCEQ